MRLLLDTHILLWWLSDDPLLPASVRQLISDPAADVWVSVASVWEIGIKQALGRLDFPIADMASILDDAGFRALDIAIPHAVAAAALPAHHRDPFDRMMIAQAQCEQLVLVSLDAMVRRYSAQLFPAVP